MAPDTSSLQCSAALLSGQVRVLHCGGAGVQAQQVRCLLALMRWLQLYILADPASAQPDVAADLEGVFKGAFTNSKAAAGVSTLLWTALCVGTSGCRMNYILQDGHRATVQTHV